MVVVAVVVVVVVVIHTHINNKQRGDNYFIFGMVPPYCSQYALSNVGVVCCVLLVVGSTVRR